MDLWNRIFSYLLYTLGLQPPEGGWGRFGGLTTFCGYSWSPRDTTPVGPVFSFRLSSASDPVSGHGREALRYYHTGEKAMGWVPRDRCAGTRTRTRRGRPLCGGFSLRVLRPSNLQGGWTLKSLRSIDKATSPPASRTGETGLVQSDAKSLLIREEDIF